MILMCQKLLWLLWFFNLSWISRLFFPSGLHHINHYQKPPRQKFFEFSPPPPSEWNFAAGMFAICKGFFVHIKTVGFLKASVFFCFQSWTLKILKCQNLCDFCGYHLTQTLKLSDSISSYNPMLLISRRFADYADFFFTHLKIVDF
ncbi:hypothetical protein QE441_003885 [Chryseobacterium sp. SORGH_AS909]|uniref:Secreted protein n=1 Tax=Chryseobacterium camelliae TaxID=1265445 RepID=A0ABU0TIC3_9FLAO|nr:hypothetical protein [Chryseobacterium camelliae]MDQ1100752.1 hypothetical protein [Chryseobacterium sp. SORGH_AS_1048]MDR6088091.1 hypothetical protein [Chryseobacterium sp. SORGH_AS_0909]MDR6132466.1 hypothetical protein [Chryseobacterium sp. SORGH_AS_1175]MDT3409326.1 hypothetical protein [Pseudacidovorax intermedius]